MILVLHTNRGITSNKKPKLLNVADIMNVNFKQSSNRFVEKQKLNQTLSFYQNNAAGYFAETVDMDISENRYRFLKSIPKGGHILDLGCGSGRDSRFFLENGYEVTPLDASAELAQLAGNFVGKRVVVQSIQEITYRNRFDGIWACASLLHCAKLEMDNILHRICIALKPQGITYMSFKQGEGERIDEKGRFFNDYTEEELQGVLDKIHGLAIVDLWTETKPLRNGWQTWVNILAQKEDD